VVLSLSLAAGAGGLAPPGLLDILSNAETSFLPANVEAIMRLPHLVYVNQTTLWLKEADSKAITNFFVIFSLQARMRGFHPLIPTPCALPPTSVRCMAPVMLELRSWVSHTTSA
jgi:hypothetical protein